MAIKKRLAALGAAMVMTISASAIGASAFSTSKYGRASGGTSTNAYISCYTTGSRTSNTVMGTSWTKTSSNKSNVYNPNVAYTGQTSTTVSVGGVGCGIYSTQTGSATKSFSLSGCTTAKTVKSVHVYSSTKYGSYSGSLSVSSD